MQKIRANADFFVNEDNSEFHYVGVSDFALPKRWAMDNGPEFLVRPIIIERRELANRAGYTGPLVFRCFKYGHPNNPFGIAPWGYNLDNLNNLAKMAAEYNSYIDFTTGDSQHVNPNQSEQQRFLNESIAAMTVFSFQETCNEAYNNGIDTSVVKPASNPNLYIRDSGAFGDIGSPTGWPPNTELDFVSYHGTRDKNPSNRFPKWLMDLNDQAGVLRSYHQRPVVLKEPMGFDLNVNHGSGRYNDPHLAKLMGHTIAYCGITFHSSIGVSSDGFDEATKQGFFFFCRGIQGALQ